MIGLLCVCGHSDSIPESSAGTTWTCPRCRKAVQLACAEALPEGAGDADFDAVLTIADGPSRVGERILLGGVPPIAVGKADGNHIRLPGNRVSRKHCQLTRLDFGPSRWELHDQGSTFGTFINDQKITRQELQPGDTIQIGEYELNFALAEAPVLVEALPAALPSIPQASVAGTPTPGMTSTAKPFASRATTRPGTLAYQSHQPGQGPKALGDCDINWVMKLRNASTLMVYTIIIGWISWRLRFIPHLGEFSSMLICLMSAAACWLLASPEPDPVNRWSTVRWLLRISAIIACAGGILGAIGELTETRSLLGIGLLLSIAELLQTALFLFYLNRLSVRLPNPGLGVLCLVLMVATPIFMGILLYAGFQLLTASGGLGSGLLAILGLVACRIGYVASLIWFNKSFS